MAPKPLPPDQLKPFPTWIGISEGKGGSDGPPPPPDTEAPKRGWLRRLLRRRDRD
jgi:hypothetical protein